MARKLGVWFVGARGAVATCAMSGARAIARGIAPDTGMVTAAREFSGLNLVPPGEMVFGGHEIRSDVDLAGCARELRDVTGIIPHAVYDGVKDDLAAIDRNVRLGTAIGCGETIRKLAKGPVIEEDMSPRAVAARIACEMREFKEKGGLDGVVVVNVASTEPYQAELPGFYQKLKALQGAITEGAPGLTAGVLYAYAAFECGFPFVNFTPSLASDVPALQEMALAKKLPHAGKDGKTGETLLKTALAPMFVARNFQVMSWEGYNMFGNRDAVVLDDPRNNEAKTRGKDRALRQIFGDPADLHTRVRIDYVPSLDDWKTAWDFIHFRGFLGTKMIMQVIWQGCDSMLAAPLVLDLIRLADLAHRRGESGLMKHLCCFFKNPIGVDMHDFWVQMDMLKAYAARCREAAASGRAGAR